MPLADQIQAVQDLTMAALSAVISGGVGVAMLDYPAYLNAGDILIYRGEQAYLRRLGVRIDYVSALHTHDDRLLRQRVPTGPILLQGGGNFGDRYPRHQRFREHIVSSFPDRTIVSLPQTMDFIDDANLARTQRVYAEHPDLHLFLRDRDGFERARTVFSANHVHFCPDSAFGCGALSPSSEPRDDVVVLKRRDGESTHPMGTVPERLRDRSHVTDWDIGARGTARWWLTTHAETGLHRFDSLHERSYPHVTASFDRQADVVLRCAVATMSRGRVVLTDRLHAAILATLLGVPVIMVDNANHKLSAAYDSYLGAFTGIRLANDFDEAAELLPAI